MLSLLGSGCGAITRGAGIGALLTGAGGVIGSTTGGAIGVGLTALVWSPKHTHSLVFLSC